MANNCVKNPLLVTDFSDEALWLEFKTGNCEAFAEMYRRYVHVLYNYGYKITSDAKLIEDSIQDLFIYLWKTHRSLAATTSIKFYLFKSLRREITHKLSSPQCQERIDDEEVYDGLESVFSYEACLIETQTEAARVAALQKALQKLTKRQREAITLRFYNNFGYQEISEIMSLNYQSVCNLIYKALHILKDNMAMKLLAVLLAGYTM